MMVSRVVRIRGPNLIRSEPARFQAFLASGPRAVATLVPRVALATLGAGAGGGAPPSSSPSHFTEHDTYDQELGRPMRVKG